MKWYLKALSSYADFNGRARRKEFWMFFFCNLLMLILMICIDYSANLIHWPSGFGILTMMYMLITFLPSLAVQVRRLHDVGKSGWMLFIPIIPIIGSIWLIVLLCTDSEAGKNKYGANPKEKTA